MALNADCELIYINLRPALTAFNCRQLLHLDTATYGQQQAPYG